MIATILVLLLALWLLGRRLAGQETKEKSGREPVPASHAIKHIKLAGRSDMGLAIDPRHRAPAVPGRRVDLAQRGSDNPDLRMLPHDTVDHAEEGAGIELGLAGDLDPRDAETLLQVFFIPDQDFDVFDDAPDDFHFPQAALRVMIAPRGSRDGAN